MQGRHRTGIFHERPDFVVDVQVSNVTLYAQLCRQRCSVVINSQRSVSAEFCRPEYREGIEAIFPPEESYRPENCRNQSP